MNLFDDSWSSLGAVLCVLRLKGPKRLHLHYIFFIFFFRANPKESESEQKSATSCRCDTEHLLSSFALILDELIHNKFLSFMNFPNKEFGGISRLFSRIYSEFSFRECSSHFKIDLRCWVMLCTLNNEI